MDKCPADILYMTFKFLSPAEYRTLCLVSKGLRGFTEPFLYYEIHWKWVAPKSLFSEPEDAPPPFHQFLRTISSTPQLAGYVTSLSLKGNNFVRYRKQKWLTIRISETVLDELIATVGRTGVPFADIWIQKLREGTLDAVLALLLSQLPNLRNLDIDHNFTQYTTLIGMVFRSAICEPGHYRLPKFEDLQEVSFYLNHEQEHERDKKIKGTLDTLPLLYLPKLERLSVSIENPAILTWPGVQVPVPSKLKSLGLRNIREAYLGKVLSVTQNIKSLRWHWYYDEGVEDQFITNTVDLDRIAATISHVRNTLTDLIISAKMNMGGSAQFYPSVMIQGSLKAMTNFDMLRRLQIPWAFLLGFTPDTSRRLQDVLPRNIEVLVLTDELHLQNEDQHEDVPAWMWTFSSILGVLKSWLTDRITYTPRVRCVSIFMSTPPWRNDWDVWNPSFVELGLQVGVQVELINFSPNCTRAPRSHMDKRWIQWVAPCLQMNHESMT